MTDYTALAAAGLSPRTIIDLLGVHAALRPRALIQVPKDHVLPVLSAISQLGLCIEGTRDLYGQPDSATGDVLLRGQSDGEDSSGLVWSEIWVSAGTPIISPDQLFADPATFLGYPACCVAEYARRPGVSHLYHTYLSQRVPGQCEINRLAAFFTPVLPMPDYFPCSLACTAAWKHSRPLVAFAKDVLPKAIADASWTFMSAPLILSGRRLCACPIVQKKGDELWADASDIIAVTLTEDLVHRSTLVGTPRMLPFVHWEGVRGIRVVGQNETTPIIPQVLM